MSNWGVAITFVCSDKRTGHLLIGYFVSIGYQTFDAHPVVDGMGYGRPREAGTVKRTMSAESTKRKS